jgi:hypothetical protein
MAEKKVTTITFTCDCCGKECQPVRELTIPMRYSMDLVSCIVLKVSYSAPYATAYGDVCRACLDEAIHKEWR